MRARPCPRSRLVVPPRARRERRARLMPPKTRPARTQRGRRPAITGFRRPPSRPGTAAAPRPRRARSPCPARPASRAVRRPSPRSPRRAAPPPPAGAQNRRTAVASSCPHRRQTSRPPSTRSGAPPPSHPRRRRSRWPVRRPALAPRVRRRLRGTPWRRHACRKPRTARTTIYSVDTPSPTSRAARPAPRAHAVGRRRRRAG
mmetsp:Transcript_14417/g.50128  ORF Transcript_14417/g.50128 Transcript_14417/m.50128 type:complete len:202 (+) Transcript_14417:513-1118(+)